MAVWRAGMDKIEATARACGYAASLGQCKRVAHIPTAETEAARSGLILEGQEQARLHLKSNPPWSHQWGPVQIDARYASPAACESTNASVVSKAAGCQFVLFVRLFPDRREKKRPNSGR